MLGQSDFHSIIGVLKLGLWHCHTYFRQSIFPELLAEKLSSNI